MRDNLVRGRIAALYTFLILLAGPLLYVSAGGTKRWRKRSSEAIGDLVVLFCGAGIFLLRVGRKGKHTSSRLRYLKTHRVQMMTFAV